MDACVSIGAAFENLEVESDRAKVKRKRDAAFYVKDKQGRRRFHGAFTGGFSAGYYNTVGTEEGNPRYKLMATCNDYYISQGGLLHSLFHHVVKKLTLIIESLKILWTRKYVCLCAY